MGQAKRLIEIRAELRSMGILYPESLKWSIDDVKRVAKENDIDISNKTEEDLFDILEWGVDDNQAFMEDTNTSILTRLEELNNN